MNIWECILVGVIALAAIQATVYIVGMCKGYSFDSDDRSDSKKPGRS